MRFGSPQYISGADEFITFLINRIIYSIFIKQDNKA